MALEPHPQALPEPLAWSGPEWDVHICCPTRALQDGSILKGLPRH